MGPVFSNSSHKLKLSEQVMNVDALYKLNDNVSPYIGWGRGKLKANVPNELSNLTIINDSVSSNFLRLGLIAKAPLNDKATVWTDLAIGTKSFNKMEVGLGYKIAKNMDFNVGYRYQQIKYSSNLGESELPPPMSAYHSPNPSADSSFNRSVDAKLKTKGWFAGVTYTF